MISLGTSGAASHDPLSAVIVDGEIVAATEDERFIRDKQATERNPSEAARLYHGCPGIERTDVADRTPGAVYDLDLRCRGSVENRIT